MSEECKHVWYHTTAIGNNMRGERCLWLVHKCRKCGLEAGGADLIKNLEKRIKKEAELVSRKLKEASLAEERIKKKEGA